MNFYYRSLKDETLEVVCTRCFLTIGSAADVVEIHRLEQSHQCPAPRRPDSVGKEQASRLTLKSGWRVGVTTGWGKSQFPLVRTTTLVLAAALVLYVVPTVFEFAALRSWDPWFAVLLPGDLAGCVCLAVLFRKIKVAVVLYCALTMIEGTLYQGHLISPNALCWMVDIIPTLVVSRMVVHPRRKIGTLIPIP